MMMLLVCFDLPRDTKEQRRKAAEYRNRLVELGFSMKQFSLYEREVQKLTTRTRVIETLGRELPDEGSIVVYQLPDQVNDEQIEILGERAVHMTKRKSQLIFI